VPIRRADKTKKYLCLLEGKTYWMEKDAARSSLRNTNMVSEEVMEALTRGGGGGRTIRRRMVMDAIITES
jgi:hypothetical protein